MHMLHTCMLSVRNCTKRPDLVSTVVLTGKRQNQESKNGVTRDVSTVDIAHVRRSGYLHCIIVENNAACCPVGRRDPGVSSQRFRYGAPRRGDDDTSWPPGLKVYRLR
ncbi:hypothetical protein EVAR_63336_1 [Eumeta japonica]|uniref:Uncharacterized protein n=1 Tax=Eumeta variegata TaxID=151549 RepID=A0A4C1YZ58_EUMVA|nr:hypothetical protein EVAR_63336_1 [Eumeta japonica]